MFEIGVISTFEVFLLQRLSKSSLLYLLKQKIRESLAKTREAWCIAIYDSANLSYQMLY